MSDLKKLLAVTATFFQRHWPNSEPYPEWRFDWNWSGPVPHYLMGGVYALLALDRVVYVGLGNSRGGGIYQERGISRRLESHVIKLAPSEGDSGYMPQARWQAAGVTRVGTIGFPAALSYLAPALEDFLIGELNPSENRIRRKDA